MTGKIMRLNRHDFPLLNRPIEVVSYNDNVILLWQDVQLIKPVTIGVHVFIMNEILHIFYM